MHLFSKISLQHSMIVFDSLSGQCGLEEDLSDYIAPRWGDEDVSSDDDIEQVMLLFRAFYVICLITIWLISQFAVIFTGAFCAG